MNHADTTALVGNVLELVDVTKKFDKAEAVHGLTMTIEGGQVFGLLGPSGSGKTTTIRLLLGLLAPTSGEVRTLGKDPRTLTSEDRENIGYTAQSFNLYPTLTVKENLNFVASLFGLGWMRRRRATKEVLQFLELWDVRHRLAGHLSGGMQRRLSLACALVHHPSLLFVDEPSSGLDPVLREKIWSALRSLREEGMTIVVTTQHIDEGQHCDSVAILNNGQLAARGTPEELRRKALGGEVIDLRVHGLSGELLNRLTHLPGVERYYWVEPERLHIVVDRASTAIPGTTRLLQEGGAQVESIEPCPGTFEEAFTRIVSANA
jgi:ABC-2 type transport system ATP-binding protein